MTNPTIQPTVGRIVWFHPSQFTGESGFARHRCDDEPYAAIIAKVFPGDMVNLTVFDANGAPHSRTSVPLVQEGNSVPGGGFYCEWMPFQKGQAAKTEAAEKAETPAPSEYRQPSQREQLEYALVSGAAAYLSAHANEAEHIAEGIEKALDKLCPKPVAALPVRDPGPDAQEREIAAKAARGCRGPSCGATDGPHSPECILEAAETQGWLDSPEAEEARQALAAKSATLVTLADIEAEIVAEAYMTGEYFLEGGLHVEYSPGWYDYGDAADNLTICVLILRNGTKLVGVNYGAIDPANHCPKKGKKEARAHAIEQAWPLLGFRLRDKLADSQ